VERDLNREYRRLLTENGIDIAFPQVVINYPQEKQFTVSKKDKREANEFAEEQSNLSKNIEEQDS
jgi:small-conductance mechanosensitive channel